MQQETLLYNLHGKMGTRFVYRCRKYGAYVDNEYASLRVQTLPEPLPTLSFYLDCPPPVTPGKPDVRIDRRFLAFRYRAEIYGLFSRHTTIVYHGDWTIHVWRNIQGILLQAQVIEPMVHLKMLLEGVLMVHSASVADRQCAAVMPAHGGTGKTTTALTLAHEGYGLLGDDLVFVAPEGHVYGYLRPLHLFAYVLRGMPFLRVPLGVAWAIRVKNVLRHVLSWLTGEQFALATRVPVQRVLPEATCIGQARLGPIILLARDGPLHRRYDLTQPTERREWLEELAPTMELSQQLRQVLLRDYPDHVVRVAELETALWDRVLAAATGCHRVNCRHPDNRGASEIRRVLSESAGSRRESGP
jgi:hypothetical protein